MVDGGQPGERRHRRALVLSRYEAFELFEPNGILVEVVDDGRGIPTERLDQIFEPSFAVADGRVTTGNWGLFNCRSIIHGLGGEIQIESVLGAGTTVKIILPVSPV